MSRLFLWFGLLSMASGGYPVRAADTAGVEITYLANEGFLLAGGEDGGEKVLIDALFPGLSGYPRLEEPVRSDLEATRPPFDGIDLVLATHFHGDHFGAEEVARHLEASEALFLSTPDALAELEAIGGGPFDAAAHYPREGAIERVQVSPGLEVGILNLHHGRSRSEIQNLGFLIGIGGLRILHVGDTEVSAEEIAVLELDERDVDVALLPGWLLAEESWRQVIDEIGARQLVVMHLASADAPDFYFGSAGSLDSRVREIRKAFPEAWIPTTPLESRRFRPAGER